MNDKTRVEGRTFNLPEGKSVFLSRNLPQGGNLIKIVRPRGEVTEDEIAEYREKIVGVEGGEIITTILISDASLESLVRLVLETESRVNFDVKEGKGGG